MLAADAPPPGFYAPDPYAARWLWIGIGILALVTAWYVTVWLTTRERKVRVAAQVAPDRVAQLRDEYTRRIDAVLARAAAGEVTQRQAHQQLSVLVRHFVQEVSGITAPTMTLTELAGGGARLTPVSEVVAALYPGEFGPRETTTLSGAGAVAKQVVARWS